jgi:hypothetical protein
MTLFDSIVAVFNDVANSVYRDASIDDAIDYARVEIAPVDLDDLRAYDVDVYDAFATLRDANQRDVDLTVSKIKLTRIC